jgi:hypothetical protein
MATIKHAFTSAKTDDPVALADGQVTPSRWNADHVIEDLVIADVTGLQTTLDSKQPLATVLTNTTAAFTTAQETKLAGIEAGATANSTDATLLNRANHTGTQAINTVTGLQTALDGKLNASQFSGLSRISVGTTAPSSPSVGDLWIDTN